MERYSATATVALCVILSACASKSTAGAAVDTNENKLSRSVALSILKHNEAAVLGGTSGRCQIPLQTGGTVGANGTGKTDLERAHAFYQELVAAGILKEQASKVIEGKGPSRGITEYGYSYATVDQPGVSLDRTNIRDPAAAFALSKPAFDEVTGISQDGNDAQVQARVSSSATAAAHSLLGAVTRYPKAAYVYCPTRDPNLSDEAYLAQATQPHTETRTYHFQKFDDGWRLVALTGETFK